EVRPEYERNSPRMSSNSYVNLKIATCLVRYADDRLIDQRFPNGTGAFAPRDPEGGAPVAKSVEQLTKDELWSAGKSLLMEGGMPAAQCGSFVGKLVKDYGDRIVIEAVRTAVVERPADPASFLKASCQTIAGERGRRRNGPPSQADIDAENAKAKALLFGDTAEVIDV
ncbi:hypothetical protein QZM92_26305, partial [Burkholderia multivorans]|nr:hypothetical protein [Burkholderia multivorans]